MQLNDRKHRVTRSRGDLTSNRRWHEFSVKLLTGSLLLAAFLYTPVPISAFEIIAHRGASAEAPENTLSAIRAGFQQANACELDIHITKDGQIVVIHDDDTFRTTGVSNRVADTEWKVLRQLNAANWSGWKSKGFSELLPLLEDVLPIVPKGKRLFIEIKCGPEVLPELKRLLDGSKAAPDQFVLIGFDIETMRRAKKELAGTQVLWLVSRGRINQPVPAVDQLIRKAVDGGLDGLDLQHSFPIDRNFVAAVHRAGLKLFTWTVDDPEIAQAEVDAGVDGITTNRPQWLAARLRQ